MAGQLLEDKPSVIGMVINPNEQFERIKGRPVFAWALMMVIILTSIGMWLSLNGFDVTKVANMEDLVDFTPEELAAFEVLSKITYIFIGLIGPILKVIMSSLLFLVIARTFHSDVTFKQLFSLNTYVLFIVSLGIFVNGLITVLVGADPETTFTSLGYIINVDGSIGAFLNNIEAFQIWALVLTAIGLQKIANIPKNIAWIITIVFFLFTAFLMITN